MAELDGKVGIVTGAAQGLGLAIAARAIAAGARIVMADLQAEKVAAAARRLDPAGASSLAVALEASSTASAATMVATAQDRFGRLDFLVNAAGGSGDRIVGGIEHMSDEVWDGVIARNLRGSFACIRAALPYLKASGDARILNFSSGAVRGVADKTTIAAPLAYAAAKAGLHGLTNQLAKDLARDGIAVNAVQPGFVLTEPGARVRALFERLSETERAAMLRRLPAPPRQPEEVGWAVLWLMSAAAKGVTGTTVRLAGPIHDAGLRLVPEGDGPFGPYARLEAIS